MTVSTLRHSAGVAAMEAFLAEAALPGGPFDPAALADLDRRSAFPTQACAALDDFGLPRFYVPVAHGGALADLSDLIGLLRAVARRDLTVAIAHGKTFLGAVSVWVAGDDDQARWLGREVARGTVVAWGLSEREHGSDLLAGEFAAVRQPTGWRLNGEKWLINNATRADLLCVLARTDPAGGPRGSALFLLDKRCQDGDRVVHLPKVSTLGIRGADISGVAVRDADVPADALIGGPGKGLETVMTALQLTRTVCASLSLGALDHGLALVLAFTRERQLYGHTLAALPSVRRILGEIGAALLLAEATTTMAARVAHFQPGELGIASAITKALVPTLAQRALEQTAELLGSRGFLTELYAHGAMEKLDRDHQIVAIFDGSTLVNRNSLIAQFPALARGYRNQSGAAAAAGEPATLSRKSPALNPAALRLVSPDGSTLLRALPGMAAEVARRAGHGEAPAELARAARDLVEVSQALHAGLDRYEPRAQDIPAAAFGLAERVELVFAGAAAIALWLHNTDHAGDRLWRSALWARACLALVLDRLGPRAAPDHIGAGSALDDLAALMLDGAGEHLSLLLREKRA